MAEDAKSEDPSTGASIGWKGILDSKITLLIVGFVLTTVLGGILNERIQSARWEKEARFKVFQNQLADGDQVQADVLSMTGEMRSILNTARRLANDTHFDPEAAGVDENGVATDAFEPPPSLLEARAYFDDVATPKYIAWTQAMHRTKNKVALIFGRNAASALLDRDDNILHVDRCSVLVKDSDKDLHVNCAERRKAEVAGLRSGEGARSPKSIHHAFRISRFLIKRMIWCKDPRETYPYKKEKCDELFRLRQLMNARYNATGTANDRLSDHILEEMLKLNAAVR